MITSAVQQIRNFFYGFYWSFYGFGYFTLKKGYGLDGLC